MFEGLSNESRMMDVPIDGYCYTYVGNKSVVCNASCPESTLKRKSNSVAYNYVRSKSAADILRITWEGMETDIADILRKIDTGPQ